MSKETRRKRAEERRAQKEIKAILNEVNKNLGKVEKTIDKPSSNQKDKKLNRYIVKIKAAAKRLQRGQQEGIIPEDPCIMVEYFDFKSPEPFKTAEDYYTYLNALR